MAVSLPRQRCYFYECGGGGFRLTYYLPPAELEGLVGQGRLSQEVLRDFPDGVELDCTEGDFADLQQNYGYRPDYSPEALRGAFFAVLSSTRDWNTFRGTGLVRADRLEASLGEVDAALDEAGPPPAAATSREARFGERRSLLHSRAVRAARIESTLEALSVPGVDPRKTLGEQDFDAVEMDEGMSAQEVFSRLHSEEQG